MNECQTRSIDSEDEDSCIEMSIEDKVRDKINEAYFDFKARERERERRDEGEKDLLFIVSLNPISLKGE